MKGPRRGGQGSTPFGAADRRVKDYRRAECRRRRALLPGRCVAEDLRAAAGLRGRGRRPEHGGERAAQRLMAERKAARQRLLGDHAPPAEQQLPRGAAKAWMPGPRPGMTECYNLPPFFALTQSRKRPCPTRPT